MTPPLKATAEQTSLSAPERRRLQALISRAAAAHTRSFDADNRLNAACDEHYGCAPSDVDADGIIDAVFGGCGNAAGMSAEAFDQEMRAAIARRKGIIL